MKELLKTDGGFVKRALLFLCILHIGCSSSDKLGNPTPTTFSKSDNIIVTSDFDKTTDEANESNEVPNISKDAQSNEVLALPVPTSLNSIAISYDQIEVKWEIPSEGREIEAIALYRDDELIESLDKATVTYLDIGLDPLTEYRYKISTLDPKGEESAFSDESSIFTLEAPDVLPPTTPGNVSASVIDETKATISWATSTDEGSGVKQYTLYRDGAELLIFPSTQTEYIDRSLLPDRSYSYYVTATDNADNVSMISNESGVTTPAAVEIITGFTLINSETNLPIPEFDPIIDGSVIDGNLLGTFNLSVRINTDRTNLLSTTCNNSLGANVVHNSSPYACFADTNGDYAANILPDGLNSFSATVFSEADGGGLALETIEISFNYIQPPIPDVIAPSIPQSLTTQRSSQNSILLNWELSTDDKSGVKEYKIYRNGGFHTSVLAPIVTYEDVTLTANTTFSYEVSAVDNDGNESLKSNSSSKTTLAEPGTVFTFIASEDTTLDSATPTAKLGSSPTIQVDGEAVAYGYLRFNISGLSDNAIGSVQLKLSCTNSSPAGGDVYLTNSSWSEDKSHYKNRPGRTSDMYLGSIGAVSAGQSYFVDLTSFVNGDGTYSFLLFTTNADGADYHSRESNAGVDFKPQIQVTVGN